MFLGWKSYGEKNNPFKNTPKDVVESLFKSTIDNNFELFMKSRSQEDLDKYAKRYGMTTQEVKEQTKKVLAEGHKNLSKANVKFSDFKIYQPNDYNNKDHVSVKVEYVDKSKYIEEDIEIPVYKASDGNWYVSQDGDLGTDSNEGEINDKANKNNDNKNSSRIADGGKGDSVWKVIPQITNKSTKLSNDYNEYSAENMPTKNNWNIPAEPCYVFYIDNYSTDGNVTDTSKKYLVGKNSKNLYILPNQGGQSAYQIKNNQKVKTFKYIGECDSQEWC